MTVGHRLTSRILLFDESGSILLFLTTAPDTSMFARWVTPGGGVDPGENHAEAAIRELFEETGLAIDDPGEAGLAPRLRRRVGQRRPRHRPRRVLRGAHDAVRTVAGGLDRRREGRHPRLRAGGASTTCAPPPNPSNRPNCSQLVELHRHRTERTPCDATPFPNTPLEQLEAAARIELDHFTQRGRLRTRHHCRRTDAGMGRQPVGRHRDRRLPRVPGSARHDRRRQRPVAVRKGGRCRTTSARARCWSSSARRRPECRSPTCRSTTTS